MATNEFQPNWVSPPGDTILDILREKAMSIADFAIGMGETRLATDALLRGHAELTTKHAKKLEGMFGVPFGFWLARENQYRQDLARSKQEETTSQSQQWLSELPIKDMVKFGWLKVSEAKRPTLTECLDFFGATSVVEWRDKFRRQPELAFFRTSSSFEQRPLAVAAWLRQGEIEGNSQECANWNALKFQQNITQARALSRAKSPADFLPRLKILCAEAGVVLAVVRTPTGCRASGAARFLTPNKAVILMSFRHLTDDHFWFTFFHEAGHLILHAHDTVFIDGLELQATEEEEEANRFSAQTLIPDEFRDRFNALGLNPREILRFAKDVGISPGIVVGQLQNSGRVRRERLNVFKQRYTWEEIDAYLANP
jgi:HTH-type transcriptional regulator / antitoxin HigA